LQDYYFEHRMPMAQAMIEAKEVILKVGQEFGAKYGRPYGLLEKYKLDDAEVAIVAMGSTCGTARVVIDELREKGIKAGMLKLRVFRPFPAAEVAEVLAGVKSIAVLDRSDSLSSQGGPLYTEVRSALYDAKTKPVLSNYIYGLGGREINLEDLRQIFSEQKSNQSGKIVYFGVRE